MFSSLPVSTPLLFSFCWEQMGPCTSHTHRIPAVALLQSCWNHISQILSLEKSVRGDPATPRLLVPEVSLPLVRWDSSTGPSITSVLFKLILFSIVIHRIFCLFRRCFLYLTFGSWLSFKDPTSFLVSYIGTSLLTHTPHAGEPGGALNDIWPSVATWNIVLPPQ